MQFQSLSFCPGRQRNDKETEKLQTNLSFVQHGVAHSFENVYDFIPVSESKGG